MPDQIERREIDNLTADYPKIACNECKGTGEFPFISGGDECSHCGGSGRVCENCEGYAIERVYPDGSSYYYCEACGAN